MSQFEPSMDLTGKVALVTGSTTGLGHEIACSLGKAGAAVALNFLNDESRAADALKRYEAIGAKGALFKADATDAQDTERLVNAVENRLGAIDILVINATPPQPQRALEAYQWHEVQTMLDAFVKSPFLLAQHVVAAMKEKRFGRMVQIGSEVFDQGTPNFSAYVAAKGAQIGLTRSLSQELAPFNITVNMVSPGWIPVDRHAHVPNSDKAAYLSSVPLGRWGTPQDVASAVTFLSSDHAAFITGANLRVNGGRTAR